MTSIIVTFTTELGEKDCVIHAWAASEVAPDKGDTVVLNGFDYTIDHRRWHHSGHVEIGVSRLVG